VHGLIDPGFGLLLELLGLRRRIYSALMARSLRGSKMAGDLEMPSGLQILMSSSRQKISCSAYSPLGLQPSRQM